MTVINSQQLGLDDALAEKINAALQLSPETAWKNLSKDILTTSHPFHLHLSLFKKIYPQWPKQLNSAPAVVPEEHEVENTNIFRMMKKFNFTNVLKFHEWSVQHKTDFWKTVIHQLKINFKAPFKTICDLTQGIESPRWLPDAQMNIADSCFTNLSDKTAIISQASNGLQRKITYRQLNELSNRIANSLITAGLKPKDAIAIDMPMNEYAVAIYLGIIKMGGVVVSIADSFSKEEIATRLKITNATAIFTQDFILRDNKKIPLYEKVIAAQAPLTIVLPSEEKISLSLRQTDMAWENFLVNKNDFESYSANAMDSINILFSSGTTGTPKAIPWTHTTAIKAASDGFFHQNIQSADIIAWPTNLGWMMGPWLIFAAFINQATLALYDGMPRERGFGQFIQDAKVSILGVVPTLVANWRQTHCMEGLNWQAIKLFTSTGECSNPEDMLYLMFLAGYKPIIEYCGGTEIGGAYVSSTVIQKNYPSLFTTPTLGLDFTIIDEEGQPTNNGEVALLPPLLGASTQLLNADHHKIYFSNMPKTIEGNILRRHGDHIQQLAIDAYCILGRVDDTMNLGAIKVSSAEIERVLSGMDDIIETAAIAIGTHGPSQLVIFAATPATLNKELTKKKMQERINTRLNPLFKIYDVVFLKELPKTASNKIMRKTLREGYIMPARL